MSVNPAGRDFAMPPWVLLKRSTVAFSRPSPRERKDNTIFSMTGFSKTFVMEDAFEMKFEINAEDYKCAADMFGKGVLIENETLKPHPVEDGRAAYRICKYWDGKISWKKLVYKPNTRLSTDVKAASAVGCGETSVPWVKARRQAPC